MVHLIVDHVGVQRNSREIALLPLSVVGSSVVVMAVSPDTTTRPGGDPSGHRGRPVLGGATTAAAALAGSMPERLWGLSDAEVGESMTALGDLAVSVDAHLVAVLAEAKRRSLGSGEGWGPMDWAHAMAPMLPMHDLRDLDTVAGALASDDLRLAEVVDAVAIGTTAGTDPAVTMGTDRCCGTDADVGVGVHGCPGEGSGEGSGAPQCCTCRRGVLPVGKAAQIVRFHHSIRGMADPDQLEEVTGVLLHSARGVDGLVEKGLAAAVRHAGQVMRPDRLVEHDADLRRAHRSLVRGPGPLGLSRYTLILDEEGAAIVDAAVDALAAPRRDADTGEHDPRTPAARRADALLDLVTRAVGAPDGVPRQAKTSLVVTIGLDVLAGSCRGAGLTMAGDILTTDTVRRMACDAQLIPAILGSNGEILDQGMGRRLFDRAQIRYLWLRDRHCTFPGCSKPAAWTDAHHLIHWIDNGPTDIANAALLCRSHHTVVHRERYSGRVIHGPHGPDVHWDLTRGSYDAHVAEIPAAVASTRITGPDRPIGADQDEVAHQRNGANGPARPSVRRPGTIAHQPPMQITRASSHPDGRPDGRPDREPAPPRRP